MKRRSFLKLIGLTAVTAAIAPAAEAYLKAVGPSPEFVIEHPGVDEIYFNGIRVIADPYCPPNHAYLLSAWPEDEEWIIVSKNSMKDLQRELGRS